MPSYQGDLSGYQNPNRMYKYIQSGTLNTTYIDDTAGTLRAARTNFNDIQLLTNIKSKPNTAIPAGSKLCEFPNGRFNADVAIYFPVVIQDSSTSTYKTIICYMGNTGQLRTREALPATTGYYWFYLNGINYNISRIYYNN